MKDKLDYSNKLYKEEQRCYCHMPSSSNTPLIDTTMPSNNSSKSILRKPIKILSGSLLWLEEIKALQKNSTWEMVELPQEKKTDLGALKYFLGVEVSRSKQGLFLSQQNYMLDLLAETVNRILASLKSSTREGIMFSRHEHLDIEGYIDSDFAESKLDKKSTSSDRVSFWSPSPSPKAFRSTVSPLENPHHRQKTLTAGEFSGDSFRQSPFPTPTIPSGAQGGDLQVLSKHRRENLNHAPATRVSSPAA
ncbi:hypothetical protein CK203_043305 [Vitis vinifera]|uniref:Mitochondrial protein n=1 Tax=Vitis vinifera TaxID=29760 RepID=A0A438GY86_VITVI|nr:hypothetical protein CK203_043305 [Vitis vinifera]